MEEGAAKQPEPAFATVDAHAAARKKTVNKVLALILAGGQGERLRILSEERAKPAVIFGGKYRIIDFTLSNCINSGISRLGILTQYGRGR